MAAQSNPPASFGYTWGFADNSRAESVVEISPNINYTVSEAVSYYCLLCNVNLRLDFCCNCSTCYVSIWKLGFQRRIPLLIIYNNRRA